MRPPRPDYSAPKLSARVPARSSRCHFRNLGSLSARRCDLAPQVLHSLPELHLPSLKSVDLRSSHFRDFEFGRTSIIEVVQSRSREPRPEQALALRATPPRPYGVSWRPRTHVDPAAVLRRPRQRWSAERFRTFRLVNDSSRVVSSRYSSCEANRSRNRGRARAGEARA